MSRTRRRAPLVLYILHSGNLYGTERMALATLEGFADYAVRVVLAPRPVGAGSVAVEAARAGHRTVQFDTRWSLVKALLPWFLRYRAIDVIATGVVHSVVCHLLGRLLRVRVRQLHVAHGGTPDSFNRKNALNRYPVTVVAVSEFVKSELIERGVRAEAIRVIDNFLSDRQRRDLPERPAYDALLPGGRAVDRGAVRVVVVSRVDAMKRVDVLVAAIETHRLHEFQFDVYGVGNAWDDLRQRAATLPNLRFHGFVPQADTLLAEADFLLHLCPDEPFGLVVLEAFAARVVAIVPDRGGAGGLVEDGVTGLRFHANAPDDLHRVLCAARDLPGHALERLAGGGRSAHDERFSPTAGARHYLDALAEAGSLRRG